MRFKTLVVGATSLATFGLGSVVVAPPAAAHINVCVHNYHSQGLAGGHKHGYPKVVFHTSYERPSRDGVMHFHVYRIYERANGWKGTLLGGAKLVDSWHPVNCGPPARTGH